jgi:hypothetical protein
MSIVLGAGCEHWTLTPQQGTSAADAITRDPVLKATQPVPAANLDVDTVWHVFSSMHKAA